MWGGRGSSFPKALRMYFIEAPNENDLLTLDSENKAIREKKFQFPNTFLGSLMYVKSTHPVGIL